MEVLRKYLLLANLNFNQYFLPFFAGLTNFSHCDIFRLLCLTDLGILGLGQTKIIVIGAGERASIYRKTYDAREVGSLWFELIGFYSYFLVITRERGYSNEKLIQLKSTKIFENFYIKTMILDEWLLPVISARQLCQ